MNTPSRRAQERPASLLQQDDSDVEWWKSLIVCCDGTGQAASHGKAIVPSNVARFARALAPSDEFMKNGMEMETQQVVLYQTGVGTDVGSLSQFFGATFGTGLDIHVLEAYHFFVNNYEKGDKLYLFGFSRGAFTARAIASFITNVGLLQKQHIGLLAPIYEAYKTHFRPDRRDAWLKWLDENREYLEPKMHESVTIPVIGLWDTVGSLGIPETRFSEYLEWTGLRRRWNEKYAFHDMALTRHGDGKRIGPQIERAFQALALDEHRISFTPTLLYTCAPPDTPDAPNYPIVEQCWFPGVHSDIGGGYSRSYLDISDLALVWMMDKCRSHLRFDLDVLDEIQVPSKGFKELSLEPVTLKNAWEENLEEVFNEWGLSKLNDSYAALKWKIGGPRVRVPGSYYLGMKDEHGDPFRTNESIHPSVRVRLMENLDPKHPEKWDAYLPPSLKGFRLEREPEEKDGRVVWIWVKDFIDPTTREMRTIRIPEQQFPQGKWEGRVLEKDPAQVGGSKLIDPNAGDKVNAVLERIDAAESGLGTTTKVGLAVGAVAVGVGAWTWAAAGLAGCDSCMLVLNRLKDLGILGPR